MATSRMTMRLHDETPSASAHIEEPASLMLDPEGRIEDCNGPAEALFGFHHDELVRRPIAQLLPQLMDVEWIQNGNLNPRLSFFCQIGRHFKAIRRDGTPFATRLFFHDLGNSKNLHLRLIIRRAEGVM